MRKHTKLIVLVAAVMAVLALSAVAAPFEKVATYTDGTFTDVSTQWYAKEVKSAYELGFVNGKTANSYDPNGTMTVAEAITLASRVHASYNGKTIPDASEGKWYQMYVNYASANGIYEEGYFNSYDRTVRRYEMAQLFANALPADYFAAKNNVTAIPDVNAKEEYADMLLKLYNAGVVMGSDDYGTFHPTDPIKRSEVAAIVNRAALPENRLVKTLKPAPVYENEAVYLIDNYTMSASTLRYTRLASGWNADNRYNESIIVDGVDTNSLIDSTEKGYSAINRAFESQDSGKMTFRTNYSLAGSTDGLRIYFTNTKGENVLEFYTDNGVYCVKGAADLKSAIKSVPGMHTLKAYIDLDAKTGYFTVDGVKAIDFSLGNFEDFSKVYISTSVEDKLSIVVNTCHLYMNYFINEDFFAPEFPEDWEKAENTEIIKGTFDANGTNTLKLVGNTTVTKKFEPVSGKFVFESFVLLPKAADTATVKVGDVAVKINNSVITAGTLSKTHKNHIWQCIHVEGDTAKDTATLYINGKKQGTVPMTADSVSEVSFTYEKKDADGYMLIDDVEVYNIYDYLDYVPTPVPANDDEYTTIMSVCSLWREGTHYGWDYVSPYDEASPLWGYYDEGIPETADWETKMMVEHGIDAFQYCWFSPSNSAYDEPIKTPRLSWSQHDGYFYSKYSDMIKFCFMWENAGWSWSKEMNLEQFKTYLWDYWVEWYFTDDRYLCVDNKPVLHIYKPDNFVKTMGGNEGVKAAIEFMREDIKNYGFDGIIILFQDSSYNLESITSYDKLGADGIMTYAWGANSYEPSFFTEKYEEALRNLKTSKTDMYIVPTVGTGRNILGWNNQRTPTSSVEQHHEVMKYLAEVSKKQNMPGNMIYFGTWNEFGEGHWLAPSGLNGFGYADTWREEINGNTAAHDDVVPTINQKERICNLYNDERTPIRSMLLEKNEVPATVIESFNFAEGYEPQITVYGENGTWTKDRLVKFGVEDGVLVVESNVADPIFRKHLGDGMDSEEFTGIRFRTKSTVAVVGQIFFITDLNDTWESNKRFDIMIEKSDDFVDYYVDCTSNDLWTGNIKCIRFDLLSGAGRLDIEKIEFVGKAANVGSIIVDGMDLQIPPYYVNNTGDEFYVVGDPDYGVFSANNFYHQWNRWTQKLYIKTGTETEFEFTVGSDKVLVNGAEKTLKKAFYTYDAMPVLPMKFILDESGIEYTIEKDLVIKMRELDVASIMEWRRLNPWNFEFDIPNDTQGFVGNGATVMVANGVLTHTAGESSSSVTGHDSGIVIQNTSLPAAKYDKVEIRFKYQLLEDAKPVDNYDIHSNFQFYFNPSTNPGLGEAKSYRMKIDEAPVDDEGWSIVTFDLAENEYWDGAITTLRFDPTNHNIITTFDYIRFILKEGETADTTNKGSSTGDTLEALVGDSELVYDMDFKENGDENHPVAMARVANYEYDGDDLVVTSDASNPDIILNLNVPTEISSAANFDTAVVRMKVDSTASATAQFYYLNGVMTSYAGDCNAPAVFQPGKNTDDDGYYLLKFDFTKNKSKFTGDIKAIRFDPADLAGTTFYIDYIKFYKCGTGGGADQAELPMLTEEDVTNPGVVYNGDAEGEDFSMWSASGAELSIVEEDDGNRAFLLTPNTGKKTWVYLMLTYDFVPGKTYKISADVKVLCDEAGTPGESKVTCNFRYVDTLNGQNGYDHNTVFAISNGDWAHMEGEYTVQTMDKPQNRVNQLSFYCNPIGELGCKYMVDNIEVEILD